MMQSQELTNSIHGSRNGLRDMSNTRSLVAAVLVLAGSLVVSGCDEPAPDVSIDEPDPELNFVRGYRSDDDVCQLTGETEFTGEFLDDAADLVTCPTGDPAAATLVADTGAVVVTQTTSFTLYSVPVR